jgi:cytochrome P450
MEPELWENPLQFRPERHLDINGNVVKSEYLLPFGLGALITKFQNFIKIII